MKNNKKKILIIAGIVFLLVIFVLTHFLTGRVSKIPQGTVGNSAGNVYNNGMFCEYNGLIYFSNPYDDGALYSMQPDGSKLKRLIKANVSNIHAGGKYLFYNQDAASATQGLGYIRASHSVCRAELDGSNITHLSSDLIFNMQLIDNNLYYLTSTKEGPEFYKMSIDKKKKTLIDKASYNFACAMDDGTVYYVGSGTNHYLYRYDTKTGSSSMVWAGNLWNPIYDNGYIYYMDVANKYRLCRYSLSEDLVEVLTHDRVDCFNIAGDHIFYQKNSATEPAMMRIGLDGSSPELLKSGNFTNINVTSEYVYFVPFDAPIPLYRVPVNGYPEVSTFDAAMQATLKAK